MVDKGKKQYKRSTISEEDISTLLQRYAATTVLALLQEVAQVSDVKIDWNTLVKKTTTGISNAREYQMLWRHLAYRDTLVEVLDDGAEPLDDDSDLDCELEAVPLVTSEASAEAAACVKVLIASGLQSDTSLPNGSTVEAPLTINIPNGLSCRGPPENLQLQGTNITVPVSVQKQPLPTVTSSERLDANGSANGNIPPRKKRKPWSTAEDLELIAAVEKCGEGNWANILKGDFKGDRTASQLSQRWTIIRKKKGTVNIGNGPQITEAQLAARRAVSLALDMPIIDNLTAACSNGGINSNSTLGYTKCPAAPEASPVAAQSQPQPQQDSALATTLKSQPQQDSALATTLKSQPQQDTAPSTLSKSPSQQDSAHATSSKSRLPSKKPSIKPALSPDDMVKAAAVAAGARIATPSDAASLLKAAQAKNAVHIMPGGSSLMKSQVVPNTLPPNVHFIRTGLAATPPSNHPAILTSVSRPGGTQQAQNNSSKPLARMVQPHSTRVTTESHQSAEVSSAAMVGPARDTPKDDDTNNSSSCYLPQMQVLEDQVAVSGNALAEHVQESQAAVSGNPSEDKVQDQAALVTDNGPREHIQDQASGFNNAKIDEVQNQNVLPSSETIQKSEINSVGNSKHSSSSQIVGGDQVGIAGEEATAGNEETYDSLMTDMPVKEKKETQSAVEKQP